MVWTYPSGGWQKEGATAGWTSDFQPGSSRGALISVEQGAGQTHPLYWPACSHHWSSESLWGRIYKDSRYFLENGEIKKTKFKWGEKSSVFSTLYLPLALTIAPECCTLWHCPLDIYADIQRFRAAALASHKLAAVAKLLFKMLKSLPVTPPESLCAFHSNVFLLPP